MSQYEPMSTDPWEGSAGREGVLVLRAWLEDNGDSTLRIRLVGRLALDLDEEDTAAVATIEEALVYVRAWLETFAAAGQG
jgi:hypothetical protein